MRQVLADLAVARGCGAQFPDAAAAPPPAALPSAPEPRAEVSARRRRPQPACVPARATESAPVSMRVSCAGLQEHLADAMDAAMNRGDVSGVLEGLRQLFNRRKHGVVAAGEAQRMQGPPRALHAVVRSFEWAHASVQIGELACGWLALTVGEDARSTHPHAAACARPCGHRPLADCLGRVPRWHTASAARGSVGDAGTGQRTVPHWRERLCAGTRVCRHVPEGVAQRCSASDPISRSCLFRSCSLLPAPCALTTFPDENGRNGEQTRKGADSDAQFPSVHQQHAVQPSRRGTAQRHSHPGGAHRRGWRGQCVCTGVDS